MSECLIILDGFYGAFEKITRYSDNLHLKNFLAVWILHPMKNALENFSKGWAEELKDISEFNGYVINKKE